MERALLPAVGAAEMMGSISARILQCYGRAARIHVILTNAPDVFFTWEKEKNIISQLWRREAALKSWRKKDFCLIGRNVDSSVFNPSSVCKTFRTDLWFKTKRLRTESWFVLKNKNKNYYVFVYMSKLHFKYEYIHFYSWIYVICEV